MRVFAQHLTHPYPAWSGCTLSEMMWLAAISGAIVFTVLMLVGLLLQHVLFCLVPFLPLTFVLTKLLLKRLADTKALKPEGFMLIQCRMRLARWGIKSPYLTRLGPWSTQVK